MDKNTLLAVGISMAILLVWSILFPPPEPENVPAPEAVVETVEEVPSTVSQNESPTPAVSSMAPVESGLPAREVLVVSDTLRILLNTQGGVVESAQLIQYDHTKPRLTLSTWIPFLTPFLGPDYREVYTEGNRVEMLANSIPGVEALGVEFEDDSELTELFHNAAFAIRVNGQEVAPGTERVTFALGADESDLVIELQSAEVRGLQLVKTLTLAQESHKLAYRLQVINRSDTVKPLKVRQLFGEPRVKTGELGAGPGHSGPIYFNDGLETEDTSSVQGGLRVPAFTWAGLEDHYFINAAAPQTPVKEAFFNGQSTAGAQVHPYYGVRLPLVEILPGKLIEASFDWYMGPKDEAEMLKFGRGLEQSLNMTLESLSVPLLALLRWIYGVVGNYGVAIIIMTIIVRLVLFPLTYRGMKNMKRMQQLAPRMKRIQEKYKNNKEKLQQEMMGLYRKNKINPLGGCLPLLLQIPVFIALYSALSSAVELRHEPFALWLGDLSQPDGLGITPILMGITLFIQQKMTPQSAMMDPTQAKLMQMMPLIFAVFSFTFPSGLVLYWVTSNVLSMAQQQVINRIKTPEIQD
ncbi:MAG: membrane protein insertase YidC [bacterium]